MDLLMLWYIIYAFKRGKVICFWGTYGFGSTVYRKVTPVLFWVTFLLTLGLFVLFNAKSLVDLFHHQGLWGK